MTPLERAMEEIQKRPSVRTPVLAALLNMSDEAVDELLREPAVEGQVITCTVEVGGKRVTEYRGAATSPHLHPTSHLFTPLKPKTAAALASTAPRADAPSRPVAPAPAAAPQEEPMEEKKTVFERALAAFRTHVTLSLDQLAKHIGTTKATIYTVMAELKKNGVRRVEDEPGVYTIGGAAAPAKDKEPKASHRQKKPQRKNNPTKGRGRRISRPAPASRNGSGPGRAPVPAGPPTNGKGAAFAINEHGELGIQRTNGEANQVMHLDPDEFARLRDFIDRTKPIWADR